MNEYRAKLYNKFHKYVDKFDYIWTNHDLITSDHLPYIGKLLDNEDMFIATGYNTWGLTNGSLAGKIIADLIFKRENEYSNIFNPQRHLKTKMIPNIIINVYCNLKAYIKIKNTKISKRCPHLGCKLEYNKLEKTWDCPCHGSRFDNDGHCFLGPSNKDIEIKKKSQ